MLSSERDRSISGNILQEGLVTLRTDLLSFANQHRPQVLWVLLLHPNFEILQDTFNGALRDDDVLP